jgi:hypothetical protein
MFPSFLLMRLAALAMSRADVAFRVSELELPRDRADFLAARLVREFHDPRLRRGDERGS